MLRFPNSPNYPFLPHYFDGKGVFRKISTLKRKNLYQILNVDPSASKEEIKKAYFSLSKKYHPDVIDANASNSIASKYFEVREAYEVLCDEEKRNEHDQRLAAEEFRINRRRLNATVERQKIYPAFGQGNQREEDTIRKSLSDIMPSVLSYTYLFSHWRRRPFHNPTEEAQRLEKEAKTIKLFAVLFLTFLVAYCVLLRRFFARKD